MMKQKQTELFKSSTKKPKQQKKIYKPFKLLVSFDSMCDEAIQNTMDTHNEKTKTKAIILMVKDFSKLQSMCQELITENNKLKKELHIYIEATQAIKAIFHTKQT